MRIAEYEVGGVGDVGGPGHESFAGFFGVPVSAESFDDAVAEFNCTELFNYIRLHFGCAVKSDVADHLPGIFQHHRAQQPWRMIWILLELSVPKFPDESRKRQFGQTGNVQLLARLFDIASQKRTMLLKVQGDEQQSLRFD